MHAALNILAVLAVVLMTGNEFAVAFFIHPVISRLEDSAHAQAAKPLAIALGRAMPGWYAIATVLATASIFTHPFGTVGWYLALSSAALLAASIIFSIISLVPINNRVARLQLDALPADWKTDRRRWDRFHVARVMILAAASIAITVAAVI